MQEAIADVFLAIASVTPPRAAMNKVNEVITSYFTEAKTLLENERASGHEQVGHICFVGHSFGAMMSEALLLKFRNDPVFKNIPQSAAGFDSPGVPHAWLEQVAKVDVDDDGVHALTTVMSFNNCINWLNKPLAKNLWVCDGDDRTWDRAAYRLGQQTTLIDLLNEAARVVRVQAPYSVTLNCNCTDISNTPYRSHTDARPVAPICMILTHLITRTLLLL
jgi:hypothetical protein